MSDRAMALARVLLVLMALAGACAARAEAEVERESTPGDGGEEGTGRRIDARDDASRALERALVREGGLVLRRWAVEIEPAVSYAYREEDGLRRDTFGTALTGRLGLPWSTQAELRLPIVLHDRLVGVGRGSGLGDLEIGLTKQLVAGGPDSSLPDLLLRARWRAPTGASEGTMPSGAGSHGLLGLLTAVERADPLVLVGSLYYSWNLPAHEVDRGDAAGATLSVLLAATPNASMLIGLDVAQVFASRLRGRSVRGTDRLIGVLDIGLAAVLGRDLFLNVTGGIGVTPAAPDFQLLVAVPLRL